MGIYLAAWIAEAQNVSKCLTKMTFGSMRLKFSKRGRDPQNKVEKDHKSSSSVDRSRGRLLSAAFIG